MRKATSLYLDILRVIAALVVFAGHCTQFWYPEAFHAMMKAGHDAVVVFFVLSGFVIAFSTLAKNRGAKSYVLARLSRLYSVVLPALVLTALLLVAGGNLNPAFYDEISRGYEAKRFILSTFFLQESWRLSASPPTNAPLWSLGYEFWYYAIFGAAVFIKPLRARILTIVAMALIVGYKVLLLMPIWLLGVALYRFGGRITLPKSVARIGFFSALFGFFALASSVPDFPVHHGFEPFYYSGAFLTDFLNGILLTATIWFFDQGFGDIEVNIPLERAVKWVADHTFSLYLFHFPLVVFATAVIKWDRSQPIETGLVVAGILGVIFVLSTLTESKRRLWHSGLTKVWELMSGHPSPQNPLPKQVLRSEV